MKFHAWRLLSPFSSFAARVRPMRRLSFHFLENFVPRFWASYRDGIRHLISPAASGKP
jgi:hypothetical protein